MPYATNKLILVIGLTNTLLLAAILFRGGRDNEPNESTLDSTRVEFVTIPLLSGDTGLFSLLPEKISWAGRDIIFDRNHVQRRAKSIWRKFVRTQYELQAWLDKYTEDEDFYRFHYIVQLLKERGLPTDVVILWVHESGLDEEAKSWAEATGICQFVRATAREQGLEITSDYDERMIPEISLVKCVGLFDELYRKYDDPCLAAAAYNMGPDGLDRAIALQGTKDYFDLQLPEETMDFCFWIAFKKEIMANQRRYGVHFLGFENDVSVSYSIDTLRLTRNVLVLEIAKDSLHLSVPEFLDANRHFRERVTKNGRTRWERLNSPSDNIRKRQKAIVRIPIKLPSLPRIKIDSLDIKAILPTPLIPTR